MSEYKRIQDTELVIKDKKNNSVSKQGILKSPEAKIYLTDEQKEEYIKCYKDPLYFINSYFKITSEKGFSYFDTRDYQKEMIQTIHDNRFFIGMMSRQMGKCVTYDTEIDVRNKKTGELKRIRIGELYEMIKGE